jgi:hypothetical protein
MFRLDGGPAVLRLLWSTRHHHGLGVNYTYEPRYPGMGPRSRAFTPTPRWPTPLQTWRT